MPAVTRCLSDSELTAFYEGSLPTESHLRTARHLRECKSCQARSGNRPLPSRPNFPTPLDSTDAADDETNLRDLPPAVISADVIGPYRILRLIGRGGMGSVYEAIHERLGRTVALKVLPQLAARDTRYLERFQREARTVGKLNHVNVVKATDAGEFNGVPFLAMELVDGVDLARLVRAVGPLPVSDAAEVVRQAAVGLAHAHSKGVIHRDVKPSNLMVTVEGAVKLLDLGLALSLESVVGLDGPTSSPALLGTHDYMAPEQWADSSKVGPPTDIYGLGCVLYQSLAGKPPFSGLKYATPRAKQYAHQHSEPPPIPGRSDVPPALLTVLGKLLAKNPAERPSAEQVAVMMKPFVGIVQLSRLVERAQLAPVTGFSDGEPTNPAPLVPDIGSHVSSVVSLPKPTTTSTQTSPTLPEKKEPGSRQLFYVLLGLLACGIGIVIWAISRSLRGSS